MSETDYSRPIFENNLLKLVTTRIDYDDVVQINKETIKLIKESLGNCQIASRMLSPRDFILNDPTGFVDLPEDVIVETRCTAIILDSLGVLVEINQYFTRIFCQVSDYKYEGFEIQILGILEKVLTILMEKEIINIKRVSIEKTDEVFFTSENKLRDFFKTKMFTLNMFEKDIDWKLPSSKLLTKSNFTYGKHKVNYSSLLESVKIDKKYLRAFLTYEAYQRVNSKEYENNLETLIEILKSLNFCCFELFRSSIKPSGFKRLENGERISDYVHN